MPDDSILTNLTHIISAIGIIVAAVASIWNHIQIRETKTAVAQAAKAVEVVHAATNSMKDELVVSVREEARAAGVLQGHAEAQHDVNSGAIK